MAGELILQSCRTGGWRLCGGVLLGYKSPTNITPQTNGNGCSIFKDGEQNIASTAKRFAGAIRYIAEMAIRSASADTSKPHGFTNQRDGDFSNTGSEVQYRVSPCSQAPKISCVIPPSSSRCFSTKLPMKKGQQVFMAAQAGRRIESNMRAAKNARLLSTDGTFFLCHRYRIPLEYLIQ